MSKVATNFTTMTCCDWYTTIIMSILVLFESNVTLIIIDHFNNYEIYCVIVLLIS